MGHVVCALSLTCYGCGSAWLEVSSGHVYVADSEGPVVLYVPSPDSGLGGLGCVDLRTKQLRWVIPDAYPTSLAFAPSRSHFYFVSQSAGVSSVRFFRTVDGREVQHLSEVALGGPDLSYFERRVAISADGSFIAAAGAHEGTGGTLLRLIATSTGEAHDVTFVESWSVRDVKFGPAGWLVVRSPGEVRSVYAYDAGGLRKVYGVSARQAWWASDRLVFITPDGRFGALNMDGARHDTPDISLGPDVAQQFDDSPERVHVAPEGEHLWLDEPSRVRLIRLSDGHELFRAAAYGHRGSNFHSIHGSYFSATETGIVYTATTEYEGHASIIDLTGETEPQTTSLGALGRYGAGLPGFDIGSVFYWKHVPDFTPHGEYLVLVDSDATSVEPLRSAMEIRASR